MHLEEVELFSWMGERQREGLFIPIKSLIPSQNVYVEEGKRISQPWLSQEAKLSSDPQSSAGCI